MPESIGTKLKDAREARRLSLDQAADATRIRAVYLQALENDDYSVMLSAAQGRGFLRNYVDFLGLNLDDLTASAREGRPLASPAPEADSPAPAESTPEPVPAPAEAKPSRPGFWSRLLRRESPAAETPKPEAPAPAPESASMTAEEPVDVPAPLDVEEETAKPARKPAAKKPARKKTSAIEEPKTATRKSAGKKKRTLSLASKR